MIWIKPLRRLSGRPTIRVNYSFHKAAGSWSSSKVACNLKPIQPEGGLKCDVVKLNRCVLNCLSSEAFKLLTIFFSALSKAQLETALEEAMVSQGTVELAFIHIFKQYKVDLNTLKEVFQVVGM